MAGRIEARLAELGLPLPPPHPPVGNYIGCVRVGRTVYIGGVVGWLPESAMSPAPRALSNSRPASTGNRTCWWLSGASKGAMRAWPWAYRRSVCMPRWRRR